ncbi:unnamed protein product [Paramecium octaurelia]|uniref:Uncharacterized protein n=1 Tax=Paramecium octaurelia TaxID=43137 RepID=A0A8S1VWG5_PAROT|nr:unnamed protein product [Paramecium octaurelia]
MNNSNSKPKQEFHIVTNMKMYFQKNIGQMLQPKEDDPQIESSSKSDYVLLPDLKSMVVNLNHLESDQDNHISVNQSMRTLSSTASSKNQILVLRQSISIESFSLDSECEEFSSY